MTNLIAHFRQQTTNLFYPTVCYCCQKKIQTRGKKTCISCRTHLPETNYHQLEKNTFTERFFGRLPAYQKVSGAAFYTYRKGNAVQKLIYELKYNGQYEVGVEAGENYGRKLLNAPNFQQIDLIVPVPLHPAKEAKRGYNQSDAFAVGLSDTMGIPWLKDGLVRTAFTETQTKKSRIERLANVHKIFKVNKPSMLEGKHILLVDDVLTTGATLEGCASKIMNLSSTKLSMATIAIAMN